MLLEWILSNNGTFLVAISIWMLYRYTLWSNSCTGSIRHYLSIHISVIEFLTSHVRLLNKPIRATFLQGQRWSQSYNEWYGLDIDWKLCWRRFVRLNSFAVRPTAPKILSMMYYFLIDHTTELIDHTEILIDIN